MKIFGLAVFKGDNLVGELSGIETISHLIVSNKFKSATLSISSPFSDSKYISIYVSKGTSKNCAKIVNGSPYINCNVSLSVRLLSASSSSNYLSEENIYKVEDYVNSYFKACIEKYLYKSSKELKSDISKFGKYAVKNFTNWSDWENYNWLNNYENSFFNVSVHTKVSSSYLIMET